MIAVYAKLLLRILLLITFKVIKRPFLNHFFVCVQVISLSFIKFALYIAVEL